MAKTRSKNAGKSKSATKLVRKKGSKGGWTEKQAQEMEGITGIDPLEHSKDEDDAIGEIQGRRSMDDFFQPPLSPRSSLKEIQRMEDVERDFLSFVQANNKCNSAIAKGMSTNPPVMRSGNIVCNLESSFKSPGQGNKAKIVMEDIAEEVSYSSPSLVCYVLGSNPPLLHILEGFAKCLWGDKVDKVKMLAYGIFIIRFETIEIRDSILNGGYIFFNRRPVIMKPWDPKTNYKKEDIQKVPTWIQLEDLDLKYWGQKSLFKIVGQMGRPIMVDEVTKERERLNYPRVLGEVVMDQELPSMLEFINKHDMNIQVGVNNEWKPTICKHCFGMGHLTDDCKKKTKQKQEWVVKTDSRKDAPEAKVDGDGFKEVIKGKRVEGKEVPAVTKTNNSFSILAKDRSGQQDVIQEFEMGSIENTGEGGGPSLEERVGKRVKYYPDTDFIECVNYCQLEDVKSTGNFFTWSNKQHGRDRISSKIDRVMANQAWLDHYQNAEANFLNEGLFDHSLGILSLYPRWSNGNKSFKYFQMWKSFPEYEQKEINRVGYSDIHTAVIQAREELSKKQNEVHQNPLDEAAIAEENHARNRLIQVQKDYFSFLQQKAKAVWIQNGDRNADIFHASIKQRVRKNQVFSIEHQNGVRVTEPKQISDAFVDYYQSLLGSEMENRRKVVKSIIARGPILSSLQAEYLKKKFTKEEVKQALFDIPGNKAPGPDGYSSKLLKEINTTVLTLVPKVKCPNTISGFTDKYLGVPIGAKKISGKECEILAEKMTARIKTWSTRNLSFAGRKLFVEWEGNISRPWSFILGIYLQPKSAGGIGFKCVAAWNRAAMGKYVWAITNKEDTLWLRWINSVYLHNEDWWDYKLPSQSSWYWKSLVRLKDQMKEASGRMVLQQKYTIAQGYNLFKLAGEKIHWPKQVWSRLNSPKHSFVLWLAMHQRLKIRDRLFKMKIVEDQVCLLCCAHQESTEHLFFGCTETSRCLRELTTWLNWKTSHISLPNLIKWIGRAKLSKLKKMTYAACLASLTYNIWRLRNRCYWEKAKPETDLLIKDLKTEVTHRIHLFWPKKISEEDKQWFLNL
uniref:Reverse transcriptase zinc-binding domain-containing protein n=1 Tax=Cannabis sativa TaxID=3483 RepID=A0A803QNJ9_CANSA